MIMLLVYGHCKYFCSYSAGIDFYLDVRICRLSLALNSSELTQALISIQGLSTEQI